MAEQQAINRTFTLILKILPELLATSALESTNGGCVGRVGVTTPTSRRRFLLRIRFKATVLNARSTLRFSLRSQPPELAVIFYIVLRIYLT